MWANDRDGTYWRRQSSWWETQAPNGQWRRATPDGPLRHMESVERASSVATIPTPAGGEVIELPPNTFIELEGDSAYEVAVKNGFVGSEAQWFASLEGNGGPPGPGSPFVIVSPEQYAAMPTPRPANTLYVLAGTGAAPQPQPAAYGAAPYGTGPYGGTI